MRDSRELSQLYGIKVDYLVLLLFGISGVLVGIAASLRTLDLGINPYVGISMFINGFVALVIGGIGRFEGAIAGGILLGILQVVFSYIFDSKWVMMLTFIILIMFLMYKPEGIIPEKQRSF